MNKCLRCQHPLQVHDSFCEECGTPRPPGRQDPFLGQNLLGQYIVKRRIGEGGFGAVYEAEQPSMQRKIAVKTLHSYLAKRPSLLARFRREGLAASRLQHPAAVKMYNLGETDDGMSWLSMEFIEGRSLEDKIQEGPLTLEEVRRLLLPICEVLEEAHQKGIIHRDLKPQNIMLPSDASGPPCKLLDFGLASLLEGESITKDGVISGTPAYMAPEQWEGLKGTDARTDIYAMGAILYVSISGELPLYATSTPDWAIKHHQEQPIPLHQRAPGIPLALSQVAMKALEKKPEARFQSAHEMKQALIAALDTPVTIQVTPPLKPKKKTPRWSLIAGALAVLMGLALFIWSAPLGLDPEAKIKEAARAAEAEEYDEALAIIDEIKQADPDFAKTYLLEGSVYQLKAEIQLNEQDAQSIISLSKGCQAYIRFIQLAPDAPEVPQLRAVLSEMGAVMKECRLP